MTSDTVLLSAAITSGVAMGRGDETSFSKLHSGWSMAGGLGFEPLPWNVVRTFKNVCHSKGFVGARVIIVNNYDGCNLEVRRLNTKEQREQGQIRPD